PVQKVALASSNLEKSIKYWRDLTGIKVFEKGDKFVSLAFAEDQARLVLKDIGGPVDHAKAYGRIAFSCPSEELKPTEALMKEKGQTILTPYTSLDTPGKKTVEVVILADPAPDLYSHISREFPACWDAFLREDARGAKLWEVKLFIHTLSFSCHLSRRRKCLLDAPPYPSY
ncbi:Glyoxalase domain-containing protein 4, partial [Armadillidium nasatum]